MNDRRGIVLGVVLVAVGLWALASRTLGWRGPGPILLLLGAVFLALSAARGFRGPLLPGGVLLGLGCGFLLQPALGPFFPPWAVILLGLGGGFLLVALLDRISGRVRRPGALPPGVILTAIALAAGLSRWAAFSSLFARLEPLWPWLLLAAGVVLIATAMRRRRT